MRVIECNECGETISAANDEELANHLAAHLRSEHDEEPDQDEVQDLGMQAEAHPPRHVPFGPWGERIDQIEVSGAWRRLQDIAHALEQVEPASPEVAAYCSRLNKLVSAVLVNAGPVVEPPADAEPASSDSVRLAVRPGVRRR